jgi:hypothetical protein
MSTVEVNDAVILQALIETVDAVDRKSLGLIQRALHGRLSETLKTDVRPERRDLIIDRAMSTARAKNVITVQPDGTLAAFSMSDLLALLEELLPILRRLFGK